MNAGQFMHNIGISDDMWRVCTHSLFDVFILIL